jgi:hypothetical protein
MRITKLFPLVVTVAVAGCIPLPFDYYEPQATSGKLEIRRGECNDVKDVIAFTDRGVHVSLSAWAYKNGNASLQFSIDKKQTDSARTIDFAADHLTLIDADGKTQVLTLKLRGESGTRLPLSAGWDSFGQTFPLPPQANSSFDIDLPELRIDGAALDISRIHFTRKLVTVMTGINC